MTEPSKSNNQFPEEQTSNLNVLLVEALLADRKADRRSRAVKTFLIASFAFGYLGLASLAYIANQEETLLSGSYASLIKIDGEIGPGKQASLDALNKSLIQAFSDSGSKGVVISINSPGGTPVQSALINKKIKELKKKYNKEVIAVSQDVVASGAYMIAVASDKIYVNESSIVGSIGVVSRRFGFADLMEKVGVESRTLTSGDSKNSGDPFTKRNPEDDEKIKVLLSGIHEQFKEIVLEDRSHRLDKSTPDLFSGKVWLGRDAQRIGLVDHIGTLSEAVVAEFGVSKLKEFKDTDNIFGALSKFLPKSILMTGNDVPVKTIWDTSIYEN